jgi:para-nitrobenzyl esterase
MQKITILILVFLAHLALAQNEVLQVEGGKIKGYQQDNILIFKGIPFATPPVGNLRWKAPQAVQAWSGIKDCSAFSASPMQDAPIPFMFWSSEFLIPKEPISEDCLYLNVWTPAKKQAKKRPVFVYIYGGGFRSGGTACPIYDGKAMAEKDVIFVSINYRVGIFGFLAHPALSKESPNQSSGNYALMDMQAALRWVQKNIEAFGGDPKNVTIAGQSAGAFAVNFLTASPLSKGLFHKAIAQSGGRFYITPSRPQQQLAEAEKAGEKWAKDLNCSSLDELRAKPASELLKAQGYPGSPIVDGYVLSQSIYDTFAAGKQLDIPTIVGWNADDKLYLKAIKKEAFITQLEQRFGTEKAQEALKVYPANTDEEATQSAYDMNRDETFGVQGYLWAKMQVKTGKSPIFVYNFNRKLPAFTPETQYGAFHSSEIVYAYNNLHTLNRPWETVDYTLASTMSSFWANFAKTGKPNGTGLPVWTAFDPQKQSTMIFDNTIFTQPLPNQAQLNFWR